MGVFYRRFRADVDLHYGRLFSLAILPERRCANLICGNVLRDDGSLLWHKGNPAPSRGGVRYCRGHAHALSTVALAVFWSRGVPELRPSIPNECDNRKPEGISSTGSF